MTKKYWLFSINSTYLNFNAEQTIALENAKLMQGMGLANLNNAQGDGTQGSSGSAYDIDILAEGFKVRVGDSGPNGSGNDIIYMAMADIGGGGTLPPIYGR